ncbi:MAG: holo-ACP synthase [Nitrospirota bacterium]
MLLVGIDIEKIYKLKSILGSAISNTKEGVLRSIFTESEFQYCFKKRYPEQHLAARFAAKEAFLKALGTGLKGSFLMSEIEVTNNLEGVPRISCSGDVKKAIDGRGVQEISVSLSHTREEAIAIVVLCGT